MEITITNPQKGRYETIDVAFTDENITWFDECEDGHGIFSITDLQGGILIKELGYGYPIWIYNVTRSEIGHNQKKAKELGGQYTEMEKKQEKKAAGR